MTEASEHGVVVRVRAQVMSRDEGTGGWLALGGGGLAHVMVGRRPHLQYKGSDSNGDTTTSSSGTVPSHEYFIHGKRISDNMVVLECTIKKDFQYNKVMPTFHHWVTDEKRFGLTFQTAADARAFDKGVRAAVEDLLHGMRGTRSTLDAYNYRYPAPKDDDEEHNIFECLNLPSDSRSSSENSTADRSSRQHHLTQTPILQAITLPSHGLKQYDVYDDKHLEDVDAERCPYVHLSAVHEYSYASTVGSEKSSPNTAPPGMKMDSGSIKKCGYSSPPPLPDKKPAETFPARRKCRHCHEWYMESGSGGRGGGVCEYAPDCLAACIETVSCFKCAQCMVYHCMSDSEGEFALQPCACSAPDAECAKRWVCLALLSMLVPCLCCYLPLRCLRRAVAPPTHSPHD